jgi:hypothetical protein
MFISPSFCLYAHCDAILCTFFFVILFTSPRFCLHARGLLLILSIPTPHCFVYMPAVLLTCLPIHYGCFCSAFSIHAHHSVYMSTVHVISFTHLPFHPICHLLYIPAVLFTRPRFRVGRPSLFCLHARRFLVPVILSIPTFSSTRLQFCLHVHHFRHLLYSHYFLNIPTSVF